MRDGGQFATRQSPWNDASVTAKYPPSLVKAVQETLKGKHAIERPVTIQVGKARDIMGVVVQAAIQGVRGAELQKIADKQNAEFQALLDEDYK
jgi:multiple sugar transport system substrate-binding protein